MRIYIKNMVCSRCNMAVESVFEAYGLPTAQVALGFVDLPKELDDQAILFLKKQLQAIGFEWIDDKHEQFVEQIKTIIITLIYQDDNLLETNLSALIAKKLLQDYSQLSKIFSAHESRTIEQFYILQKIERVKELLEYDELNLSQIAEKLHYSSVAHLSSQFKKVTGVSPSKFMDNTTVNRKQIDLI